MKLEGKITIAMMVLLAITSVFGVCSINFNHSYEVINQYGNVVKMYGYGIYAHDTYFHAPIAIGTDMGVLFCLIPFICIRYVKYLKCPENKNRLWMFGLSATAFYYATSIGFGTAYNRLHLVYIALFGTCLYATAYWFLKIDRTTIKSNVLKGEKSFLFILGIALIVAWLPDIIPSFISGEPLELIGIYTTEITYVIDMGAMAPLCFVILHFLRRENILGDILISFIYCIGMLISVMIILGTFLQYASGLELPVPALITKALSFIILGIVSIIFWRRRLQYSE